MERKIVLKQDILDALLSVGVSKGQTIMVHTSLSSLGFVCGGAQMVIEALIEAVGNEGTIMMPTQSWKNLDPTTGVHWEEPEDWWQLIRDNWPAYNKEITPTNTMGAVAEMFRKWPGALRSDHPARSVAAWGKYAEYLTAAHDLSNIFGDGSPIGKLYELDGLVLLIGVGYDKNTSLHLADVRADYPGKHNSIEHSAVMENGHRLNTRSTNNGKLDYAISTEKIDHIEVLRGPASSLYGNVALTAVVNIITREGKEVNGVKGKYGYGSYGTHRADFIAGTTLLDADVMAWASSQEVPTTP